MLRVCSGGTLWVVPEYAASTRHIVQTRCLILFDVALVDVDGVTVLIVYDVALVFWSDGGILARLRQTSITQMNISC